MKNLIIIGASALGREVASWAENACSYVKVKGFLDSRTDILNTYKNYPPILDSVENYQPKKNDVFICALGEPEMRQKYVTLIENKDGIFISLIHPKAYIGKNVTIGSGTIIRPNVILTTDIIIGNHCVIGVNSSIGHDCILDDFVTISPGCDIAGWCHIHSNAFLGVHSAVIPHVELGGGGGTYVAAGAIVTRSYALGRLMGIPAKIK